MICELPCEDLTTDIVEIKLDKQPKTKTMKSRLKEAFSPKKPKDLEEGFMPFTEWFNLSEISIHETVIKKFVVRNLYISKLG